MNMRKKMLGIDIGTELRKIVQKDENFTPMIENGRDLILQGVSTLQEVVDKVVTVQ